MASFLDIGADDKNKETGRNITCRLFKVPRLALLLVILVVLAAFVVVLILLLTNDHNQESTHKSGNFVTDDEAVYRYASVASSTRICSEVGKEILLIRGGSAVDAAIATLVCVGLVRFHSSGIGGDSFWTIYDRESGKAYSILARSRAPFGSNSTMFVNKTKATVEGGLSVAVPGEVMALWEAHKKFGRLPWKELFQPSIRLAEEGFPLEASTAVAIQSNVASGTLNRFPTLSKLLKNPVTDSWLKENDVMRNPALAKTLRKIADEGADVFYNGSLADDMVEELQNAGGIITKEDFAEYYSHIMKPLQLRLHGNITAYCPTLPSGGPVMLYILNILSGYNMKPEDIANNEKTVLTYHRHLEAFKHAYAVRSKLGSTEGETSDFADQMKQVIQMVTSIEQGEIIRRLINDTNTFPWKDYNPSFDVEEDAGTSHLSVLAANGDAVSVTSTINLYFGSKIVGNKTGIIYNNMMDDFSVPGVINNFGVKPSPSNFVKPGKRPLSSMSPTIVVDENGMVVLVVGAAGGTRITTTTAFLTSLTLWLGKRMKPAMDSPRIHHQLLPNEVVISKNTPEWLINGLKQKGHVVKLLTSVSTPAGILQKTEGQIYADAPGFIVDGY